MSKLYICGPDQMTTYLIEACLDTSRFGRVEEVPIRHKYDIPTFIESIPCSGEIGLFDGDKIVCVLDAATDDRELIMSMKSSLQFLVDSDKVRLFCCNPFLEQQFGFPDRMFNDRLVTDKFRDFVRCCQNQLKRNEMIKEIQKFIDE